MDRRLSPAFVRMTYNTEFTGVHHLVQTVKPSGTPVAGTEPSVLTRDGTAIAIVEAWDGFLDHLMRFFNGDALFGLCEFYTVDADTGEGTFIFAWNAARVGEVAAPTVKWSEGVLTFKTIGGGSIRLYMMEGISPVDAIVRPPFVIDTNLDELAVYATGEESILYGRDGSYAFAPITWKSKTSDVLRARGLN